MSEILMNERVSKDFYILRARNENRAKAGQFYMLRAWDSYPVLSRPLSVFDTDGESVSFLYKTVGEGTRIFSGLKPGDEITLLGPCGNGFPEVKGKIALIGGGAGIAPLYLAAKQIKASHDKSEIDLFLGFSDEILLENEFSQVADRLVTDVGGYITDKLEPSGYDFILTCGPEIMMRKLCEKCAGTKARVYVSLESRMACGIGSCLACTCKTAGGNRKVCKDGPVFEGEAVFSL